MDRISATLKKLSTMPFLFALGMNVIILAVCLILGNGKYSSLDDYFMSSVLTGAYGSEYDVHLYFINVIYGYFLKPFYILFPQIGWYAIFELVSVFMSFTAMSYVIIKRFGSKLGCSIAALFLTCVSIDVYMNTAFTQCAGVATAAFLFLFAVGNEKKKRSYLFFSGLFMIVGISFRKDMFLLGMPTLAAILFFSFMRDKTIWRWSLIALALFATAYVGLEKFNSNHYKNEGYDYYAAYQGPRAYFGDGAFYDADAFVAELYDRGMNGRDFRYLKSWYFYDNNVFSLDSMNRLIKIADRNRYKPNYIKMPFAVMRTLSDTLLRGSVWCWAFLCLTLIFFSNRKNWYIPWFSLFLIAVPYVYLLIVNRVVPHVETGIWAYAVIFALFFIDKCSILKDHRARNFYQIIPLICIASMIITGTFIAFDIISKSEQKTKSVGVADWETFLEYARERPNDVFLLPFGRYKELATHIGHAYSAIPPGSWSNLFSSGYWNIHLPAINYELDKRGVNNLIKDIVNENVYVVSDENALSLVPYYSDHYHEKLCIDTLKKFGNMELLKYRKEEYEDEKR